MTGQRRRRSHSKRRRPSLSRSTRAELQFPVSRVDRLLREGNYAQRLSSSTPVFLAGVLEYLTANILELAGNEAHNHHKMRITPEHVETALDSNPQLSRLLNDVTRSQMDDKPRSTKK
ncbi:histone H2A-Bbd type 1 [Loxodonta africana]|uniref:histone H2A-Bbd type 1 n=1 Tax=Loxodonta africana TaxID=9785 RepID=UPI0002236386|nr:histone H2A-Bbd type 1-like [Loxodonta africana]XP_049727454.1 histone H2A-Bbd type 1 [Elephas maximus indicus]